MNRFGPVELAVVPHVTVQPTSAGRPVTATATGLEEGRPKRNRWPTWKVRRERE
uniref:Uncharacterized protein n=1 Tax=Arundo donax TaxID=35708 RepID=A0A0A8YB54_ARUDO